MKKILTFSNFMVLLGIMTILFYLIPAVTITPRSEVNNTTINLFAATFGGSFSIEAIKDLPVQAIAPCGALITAFVLGIVGIVLSLVRAKIKYANLLACPFYIASGVIVAFAAKLIESHLEHPFTFNTSMAPGAITVATFFCILGAFALIDFIASVAKPKQVNPAY